MAVRTERGWARALRAMEGAVQALGLPAPEVGRVRKVGQGLSRSVFAAEVDPGVEGWPRELVALVPSAASGRTIDEVEREARLLGFLARQRRGLRVPGIAVAVPQGDEAILVCERVAGIPVDLRAGRMGSVVPWELVGTVAARVHAIPTRGLEALGGYATRREHGEHVVAALAVLADAPDRDVREALRWLLENLPPDEPARLVHGDLLGQNLLHLPDEPVAVIDWERALLGDPAYDLAIVTRGVRRPFQIELGLSRLLAAYDESGGAELREEHVRFHEIALHVGAYARAISGEPDVEPAEQVLARLRNLLRAVHGGT